MAFRGWRPIADALLGAMFAGYLSLVKATTRFVSEPPDRDALIDGHLPIIIAMWHGQHLMMHFAWPSTITRAGALISRHRDAGAQAAALRWFGIEPIRGSGGRSSRIREKGGASATLSLKRLLDGGASIAMTADIPKRARVAGVGIVTLAKISGRPIAPVAVVSSRRINFNSWDRASIGLPFSRGAIVVGDLIEVAADANDEALEAARLRVQASLDEVHRRAYALVGGEDPGAELRPA